MRLLNNLLEIVEQKDECVQRISMLKYQIEIILGLH
jgi:hypothetical protein